MALKPSITYFSGRYCFLSNFHPSDVEFEGLTYPTVEHAFQAAKTLEPAHRAIISNAETPGRAKRLGRMVELRPMWGSIRVQVMKQLLRAKFADEFLADALVQTHPAKLIEGNTWGDRFWGMEATPVGLLGKNNLGKLLMQVREELRDADGGG